MLEWLFSPWAMVLSGTLWLLQAVAYFKQGDVGHVIMAICYAIATYGMVYSFYSHHP